jgi:hypothetical protein
MIAILSLIRESGSMEHYVSVEVREDKDGDIVSTVISDVPERYLSHRYGEPDIEFSGTNLFNEGDEIELTDAELEEAKKAIADNLAAYNAQKKDLIAHLNPEIPAE